MSTTKEYKRLGDYIEKCEGRNSQGLYGEDDVLGVNNEGNIVKSKAKLHGVDLSPYKIVLKNNFVYNPARLDLGSISLYKGDGCVVSTLYVVFKVREDKKEELLTEYLDLWLKRKEFHRFVGYINWGSAREYFWYDNIAEVMLPVPSIEEQRRIVNEYQTVERRIANNEKLIQKLEETAQAIYYHTFVEGIDENNLPEGWRMGCLGDCGDIITGKTPSSDNPEDFGEYIQFMTPVDFHSYNKYIISTERRLSLIGKKRLTKKFIPKESVIVTCIGSDMGKVAINYEDCISNQQINSIVLSHHDYKDYIFYYLHSKREEIRAHAAGSSTMLMLNKDQFEKFGIIIPPKNTAQTFSQKIMPVNSLIKSTSRELIHLRELLSLLTSKLA